MSRPMNRRGGFTILEIIIAMGMAMVVLAGVVMLYTSSNRSYVKQDQIVTTEQNIRSSMEIMAHEFRMAGYIPLDALATGTNPVTTDVPGQGWSNGTVERMDAAAANSLTFMADMDGNDRPETIRYALTGTTLTRRSWEWQAGGGWASQTVPTGAVTLATNVTGLSFLYTFDNGVSGMPSNTDASPDNDRDDVRAITISMTAQSEHEVASPGGGGGRPQRTLQTFIKMRNMGLDPSIR